MQEEEKRQDAAIVPSPLGNMILTADPLGLTGLWFERAAEAPLLQICRETLILAETKRWLSIYFSGREPDFMPPLHMTGTPFQMEVWKILREIPYGRTTTYGEIAKRLARRRKLARMSAQAVGGAVGRNPVSILVPCHRVIGFNGNLTGYAGGIERKKSLLQLEGIPVDGLSVRPMQKRAEK